MSSWQTTPEVIFVTLTENSSIVANDTQVPLKYTHHRKSRQGRTSMCEHSTKTTPVFLPADGEDSWFATSKFGLLAVR